MTETPVRTTVELTPADRKRLEWLLSHEEAIEDGVRLARDAQSMARLSRIVWAILLGLGSLIGTIIGIIALRKVGT